MPVIDLTVTDSEASDSASVSSDIDATVILHGHADDRAFEQHKHR